MKAAGPLPGSHPRTCFGKKVLRQCGTSRKRDHVVLIDLDCDNFPDVIIVDVPDYLQEKSQENSSRDVISIDDDSDDESVEGVPDTNNDATTSDRVSPMSNDASNHSGSAGEDCLFVRENRLPVNLSRNRYGLSAESESCSSESDCSDCEFMEGSSGELHEEWEKASLRRKRSIFTGSSGVSFRAGFSTSNLGVDHEATGVTAEGQAEGPDSSSSHTNADKRKETAFSGDGLDNLRSSVLHQMDTPAPGFEQEQVKEPDIISGSCLFNRQATFDEHYDNDEGVDPEEEDTLSKSQIPSEERGYLKTDAPLDRNGAAYSCSPDTHVFDGTATTKEHENLMARGPTFQDRKSFYDHCDASESRASCSTLLETEAPITKSLSDGQLSHSKNGASLSPASIIMDRQRVKETDEYKRAMEEEWAARKRQLELQAEEAQRLRKRKKAESMRLINMEKRQQQRLDEMREAQKKDAESMNLKEQIRVEIRRELHKLEMTCPNMASLLQSLGIPISGGLFASSQEVQAAYKRALLRFHPDRASRTDVRQQVESEEKFKLISRMKEKFSSGLAAGRFWS